MPPEPRITVFGVAIYATPRRGPKPRYHPSESEREPDRPVPSPAYNKAPGRPPALGFAIEGLNPLAVPLGSNGAPLPSQRRP